MELVSGRSSECSSTSCCDGEGRTGGTRRNLVRHLAPEYSSTSPVGRRASAVALALAGVVAVVLLTTRHTPAVGGGARHGERGMDTLRLRDRGEVPLIQEAQVASADGPKFDGPDKIFDPKSKKNETEAKSEIGNKSLDEMSRVELIATIEALVAREADAEAHEAEKAVPKEELEAEAEEAEQEEEAAIADSEAKAEQTTTSTKSIGMEATTWASTTTATTTSPASIQGPTSTVGAPVLSSLGDSDSDKANCGSNCLVGILSDDDLKQVDCDDMGSNCLSQKCCALPGMQCYEKNSTFAQCKETCVPGVDLRDEDRGDWTCRPVGSRTPGPVAKCSGDGDNCLHARCCELPGTTCFLKNSSFAACKAECAAGERDQSDEDPGLWKCLRLGPKTRGAASWVSSTCSKAFAECSATKCCAEPGTRCFEKDRYWAQCLPACAAAYGAGPDWSCKALGEPTPPLEPVTSSRSHAGGPEGGGKVAQWVADSCAGGYEDCSKSRCCKAPGHQCYLKSEWFGMCKESCSKGGRDEWDNSTWSCEKAGPRSYGLALKGFPSLYCWSLIRVSGYELQLVRKQAEAYAGIFACDGHRVVSDAHVAIRDTTVSTINVSQVSVGVSSDGTAANTLLFIKAWEAVFEDRYFENFDWTIKVDPDAVLLPDRMREHVRPHTRTGRHEDKHYILNCNAYPDQPAFPMMYGSVEVFSRKAILAFSFLFKEHCVDKFEWQQWGEDVFMVSCMNALGVGKLTDFRLVGDNTCIGGVHNGADCNDGQLAAFHPFKDVESWADCFHAATGVSLPVTVPEDVRPVALAMESPMEVWRNPTEESMWAESKWKKLQK